jgi:hypothetical protein
LFVSLKCPLVFELKENNKFICTMLYKDRWFYGRRHFVLIKYIQKTSFPFTHLYFSSPLLVHHISFHFISFFFSAIYPTIYPFTRFKPKADNIAISNSKAILINFMFIHVGDFTLNIPWGNIK